MGAEEIDHCIDGDVILGIEGVAAVERGQPEPAVLTSERNGHAHGRSVIQQVLRVHEAVIATGTVH